jgi:N-acetylmuramoyl-L-alanine amidase
MKRSVVKDIQRAVRKAGFDPGPIDGIFGPNTAAAVAAYQADRELLVDGEVGPDTASHLRVVLS